MSTNGSTAAADGGEEDESEKVLKLIRDLQEIATTQTKTTSSPVKRPDSSTMATTANEEERELDQMLSDLGVFQAYVTKLLDEQERGGATLGTTGEMVCKWIEIYYLKLINIIVND